MKRNVLSSSSSRFVALLVQHTKSLIASGQCCSILVHKLLCYQFRFQSVHVCTDSAVNAFYLMEEWMF